MDEDGREADETSGRLQSTDEMLTPSKSSPSDPPCTEEPSDDFCAANSTQTEETYAKRKATGASFAGHMYEVKMLALLYLRLLNSQTVHEFRLATNLEGLFPLDDVVVTYTTTEEPKTTNTIFIQLKHRIKKKIDAYMFKSTYGDFYLRRYLKAFSRIKEMFSSGEAVERPVLFRGGFERCQFLIYTPAPEGKMFGKVSRNKSTRDIDALLKTGSVTHVERKEKIFKFNRKIDEEIFSLLGDDELGKELLTRLRVFAGQALEDDLEAMIKTELGDTCPAKTPTEIDFVYRSYLETFQYWWRDSNVILNQNSNVLNKCVVECKFSQLSLLRASSLGVKFNGEHLFDVNVLDEANFVHIVTERCSVQLGCTKLEQSLRGVKGGYIILSLDALLKETETVLTAWNSGSKDRLVIASESTPTAAHDDVCKTVDKHLQQFNVKHTEKKLILVSVQDDPFVSTLKQTLGVGKCKVIEDTFQLAQLGKECKERILKRIIVLQGESVSLGEIFGEESDLVAGVVNDELVGRGSGEMALGAPLVKDVSYYVSRSVERRDVLSEEVLATEMEDVLVVLGVTKQELEGMIPSREKVGVVGEDGECRFLVAESEDARHVAKALDRKESAHLLRMGVDGCLRWIATRGNDGPMREFVKRECATRYSPDTGLDLEGRVILLIAEPGMGKTTFVTHLASETKRRHPRFWVVRVNLREHKKLLDDKCEDAVGFLSAAVGVDRSPKTGTLFRHVVETTGNCVVFLDGFDEIAPKYTAAGLSLVRSLSTTTNVSRIYVTSRHAMRDTLEAECATWAFTLSRFDADDQETFFERFWSRGDDRRRSPLTPARTRLLVKHCVALIGRSLRDDAAQPFMGIPLHAMMLAEIYEDRYSRDATVAELPEKLDILTIFEKVIDKKFEIYLRKRFPDAEDIENEMKKLSKSVYKEHMYASLELLLGKIKVGRLHKGKKIIERNEIFYEEINTSDDKTGIIVEVLNGRPVFLHGTFAEYFAARWFSANFRENRDFLRGNLLSAEFNVIRVQFDRILAAGRDLLAHVLDDDTQRARSLLSGDDGDLIGRVADLGGRSALHLAAALDTGLRYEHPDDKCVGPRPQTTVQLLLEYGTGGFDADDVTGWSPLGYAARAGPWDSLEHLLEGREPTEEDLAALRGRVAHGEVVEHRSWGGVVGSTPIHAAAAHGHVNLARVLGPADVWARDARHRTPLHVACRWGELRTARTLIGLVRDDALDDARRTESPDIVTIVSDEDDVSRDDPECLATTALTSDLSVARGMTAREYVNASGDRELFAPLHFASAHGHSDLVRLLVAERGNVWMGDTEERTPLHLACEYGSETAARALLASLEGNAKAAAKYVNRVSRMRRTALHEAAERGFLEVLKLLVAHGGDVTRVDATESSALHYACGRGDVEATLALIDAVGGDAEAVRRYVNATNSTEDGWPWPAPGASALQLASRCGHATLVRRLVATAGGDAWAVGRDGGTLLHDACRRRDVATARCLVDSLGDDPRDVAVYLDVRDGEGRTARDLAALDTDSKCHTEDEGMEVVDYLDKLIERCLQV